MRLAVVSPFVDRRHGTERALSELLERFAGREDCEIHLYSQRVENLPVTHFESSSSRPACFIFWHKVPSIPGPHLLQFLAWLILNSLLRAWDRLVHKLRFDIVLSPGINCFDADVVIVHALFSRLTQLSLEEQRHSARLGFLQRLHRRIYYGLLGSLERNLYSDPKISLASVSRRTAKLIEDCFHRRDISVIPNGVNAAEFSPAARLARRSAARLHHHFGENHLVILLIGNDWRVKGLPTIFDAMASCGDLPIYLLVAGGDVRKPYQEQARRLRILERVRWVEPGPEALSLYAAADVYVSPTLEDAFALPPLEAMACGLPVITSVNNGGSQIVTDGVNGFVMQDATDASVLAALFRRCFEDLKLRETIGASAAKTALQFSWDRHAGAVWQLLQEAMLKKRGAPPA